MTSLKLKKNNSDQSTEKRSLIRRISGILPATIRHHIIRSKVTTVSPNIDQLVFKLASTTEELEAAYSILHDSYVHQGYMEPSKSGLRFVKYFMLPSTSTLVVKKGHEVIGTMSIIRKTNFGLPMEAFTDLSVLNARDSEVAEISSLAIHKNHRGQRGEVFLPLCRFLQEYCSSYMKLRYLTIAVHPNMADIYEALFGFKRMQKTVLAEYSFANNNPAVPMVLDLEGLYDFLKQTSTVNNKKNHESLFSYFFERSFPQMQFPIRSKWVNYDPVLKKSHLEYFINRVEVDGFLNSLSEEEKLQINKIYLGQISDTLKIQPIIFNQQRFINEDRFTYATVGSLEYKMHNKSEFIKFESVNISNNGLSIKLTEANLLLKSNNEAIIRLWITPSQMLQLRVQVAWMKNSVCGLKIIENTSLWNEFVGHVGAPIVA